MSDIRHCRDSLSITAGNGLDSSAGDKGTCGAAAVPGEGSLDTMTDGMYAMVVVGVSSLDAVVVVVEVRSIGTEFTLGTFGLAGGVRHTNVGVHGVRTVDASELACAHKFVC